MVEVEEGLLALVLLELERFRRYPEVFRQPGQSPTQLVGKAGKDQTAPTRPEGLNGVALAVVAPGMTMVF